MKALLPIFSLLSFSLNAAVYYPPQKTLFLKIDQLPIDVTSMQKLSTQLLELTKKEGELSPEQLQACAKLIAIATQLDPSNSNIAAINQRLREGKNANSNLAAVDTKFLESILGYLGKSDEQSEAQELKKRIEEALTTLNISGSTPAKMSSYSWDGIVAPLSEFQQNPEQVLLNSDRISHSESDEITDAAQELPDQFIEELDAEVADDGLATWHATQFKMTVPYIVYSNKRGASPEQALGSLKITIKPLKDQEPNKITFSNHTLRYAGKERATLSSKLTEMMRTNWPDGFTSAEISLRALKPISPNSDFDFISSATSTALDASLLDQQISTKLIIALGQVHSGRFIRGRALWDYLPKLSTTRGGNQMLVSEEAEGDLKQMLLLGEPDFIVENEIIAVTNLKDSREYRGVERDEKLTKASELFREVQTVMEGKSIRSMALNTHVREKLRAIYQLNPRHLSAKLLLILGSGSRPNELQTKYLGYEIKSILTEIRPLLEQTNSSRNGDQLIETGDAIEKRIDKIKVYTEVGDRFILNDLENLASRLRSAGRSANKSQDFYSNSVSRHYRQTADHLSKAQTLLRDLNRQANSMLRSEDD